MNTDHICQKCHKGEPEVKFHTRISNGRRYKRHLCTGCYSAYRAQFPNRSRKAAEQRFRAKIARWKVAGLFIERWILEDSRRSDRRFGRANDLDKDFIKQTIADGCCYCGETKLRMTLDRIDNAVGHLKTNVKSACIRCNVLRRNMPYTAWLVIVPAIRKARELGLFNGWLFKSGAHGGYLVN